VPGSYGEKYTWASSNPDNSVQRPARVGVEMHTCDEMGFTIPVQAAGVTVAVTICVPDTVTSCGSLSVKLHSAPSPPGSATAVPAAANVPASAIAASARPRTMSGAYAVAPTRHQRTVDPGTAGSVCRMRERLHWLSMHGAVRAFATLSARRGDPQARLLADPEVRADPFPYFEELRARGPLVRTGIGWLTVDHGVAHELLRSEQFRVIVVGENVSGPDPPPPVPPFTTSTTGIVREPSVVGAIVMLPL